MNSRKLLISSLVLNVLLIGLCASLAFVYRDRIFQRLVMIKGEPAIIMYGNSITAQGNWVELLGRTDVLNQGLPGHTTHHFLQLVKSAVIDHHPNICFVKAGINDITVGVTREKMQRNYKQLLDILMENSITPVVTLTVFEQNDPSSKQEVEALNEFLINYCKSNQITYIDLNPFISDATGLKKEYAVDKTHLNEDAYEIWAKEVNRVLKEKGI